MLRQVDTLVVDKTGTLTEGKPRLVDGRAAPAGFDERELLRLAAGLERGSEHPLAAAIVAGAEERGIEPAARRGVPVGDRQGRAREGRGAAAWRSATARCWTSSASRSARPATSPARAEELRRDGQTVMFVAVDGRAGRAPRRRRPDQGGHAGGAPQLSASRGCGSSC